MQMLIKKTDRESFAQQLLQMDKGQRELLDILSRE